MSLSAENTKLSSSTTVAQYQALEKKGDRKAIGKFIIERFEERYFRPIEDCPSRSKHGFTIIAVCCIVIESLESFYEGLSDTKGKSTKIFHNFFERDLPLRIFSSEEDWFFNEIRCGILHQSETRGGWRILRSGSLLDVNAKTINATKFLRELKRAVAIYANQFAENDDLWNKFQEKMSAVCTNCEQPAQAGKQ